MNFEWIIPVLVFGLFGAFVYHRKRVKKDGKNFLQRYSGGKLGTRKE